MKINLPITGRSVDFAPDANILSTTDLDSSITYANPDFIQVSGYELSELLGSPHNLLRHLQSYVAGPQGWAFVDGHGEKPLQKMATITGSAPMSPR